MAHLHHRLVGRKKERLARAGTETDLDLDVAHTFKPPLWRRSHRVPKSIHLLTTTMLDFNPLVSSQQIKKRLGISDRV